LKLLYANAVCICGCAINYSEYDTPVEMRLMDISYFDDDVSTVAII